MAKLVCLANSRKNANRCIAGMTPDRIWMRPVSKLADGSIPMAMRVIDHEEPALLDVLDIPTANTGPDFGHQPENRLVEPGRWRRIKKLEAARLLDFCEQRDVLLHTQTDRVPVALIAGLDPADRYSLQLIRVSNAKFYKTTRVVGQRQYRVRFTYADTLYDIVVTDPVAEARVEFRHGFRPTCMLTASIGGPYDDHYFKFIAGVSEL